jgi:hypothetical protein
MFTLQGQNIYVKTIEDVEVEGSILRLNTSDGLLEFFLKSEEIANINKAEILKMREKEQDNLRKSFGEYAKKKGQKFIPYQYKDSETGANCLISVTSEEKKQLENGEVSLTTIKERRNQDNG